MSTLLPGINVTLGALAAEYRKYCVEIPEAERRYVVWDWDGSGWGNRVRGFVHAFVYAVLTRRCPLINHEFFFVYFNSPLADFHLSYMKQKEMLQAVGPDFKRRQALPQQAQWYVDQGDDIDIDSRIVRFACR